MNKQRLAFLIACLLTSLPLHAQTSGDLFKQYEKAEKASDWPVAEKIARQGLEKYPDETGFASCLTWALRRQKRAAEALAVIEPVYKKKPGDANLRDNYAFALVDLGWERYEKKDNAAAREYFGKAVELLPDDEWTLNAWGVILRDTGVLAEGIGFLEKGYKRFPGNAFLKGNLAWAYIVKANELKQALPDPAAAPAAARAPLEAWFAKAAGVEPEGENYLLNYGIFLAETGRSGEALVLFEKGERAYPGNAWFAGNIVWALILRDRELRQRGQSGEALALLSQACRRYPEEIWLAVDRADVHWERKDYNAAADALAALALMKSPLENRKPFTGDRAEAVYSRASRLVWKFAELGDLKAGRVFLDCIARAFPGVYFVKELRGLLAYHGGDRAAGIRLVNEAYDEYSAAHPESKVELILDLPLKGIYRVGGNNRSDAITHAGLNRFCYDFMGANERGEILKPGVSFPGNSNTDYFGFGADIFCPVDGVVEEVVDRYDDLTPRALPVLGDANQITVRDAAGYHYLFVHNRRGSARVRPGQAVKKGDKLAELGNNGYSAQPHFHFGVYTADWKVSVAVRFSSYTLLKDGAAVPKTDSLPQTDEVISR
jgi:tetratricopeptide (TPR) repeat protein